MNLEDLDIHHTKYTYPGQVFIDTFSTAWGGFILIMNQSETRFFVWKKKGLAMIFREMLDEAGGADFQLFWHTIFVTI